MAASSDLSIITPVATGQPHCGTQLGASANGRLQARRCGLALKHRETLVKSFAYIKVCDNSAGAAADGTVPDPLLVLEMVNRRVTSPAPDDLKALPRAPEWAKPILEAALRGGRHQTSSRRGSPDPGGVIGRSWRPVNAWRESPYRRLRDTCRSC